MIFIQNENQRIKLLLQTKAFGIIAIKPDRGRDSITEYATHFWQMKMSNKHLLKLRTKYRKFDLTEFDEWYFGQSITTQIAWSRDDFHHYRYIIG